jgi:hypothetical protein
VCLLAVVGLAILVSSYPYFNRTDLSLVGSDSSVYYKWMVDMSQKDPWIALQKDRPLSDLLMYSVQHAFGLSSETIVKIMPIVCCVGLALAVFWFVRVGLNNDVLALVAGLFTIFSFQTTVGIYAYSISNWLGLIWAFAMFASLLKSDDRRSWAYMFAAVFFGVALLFTHPYTWDVMMAVLSVYLVWTFFRAQVNADEKMHALRLVSILGINISAYMVYAVLPFGRGVSNGAVGFAERSVVFPSILGLQGGLETMVKSWVGGLYANTLLVILAVLGMFSVVAFANRFSRLMFLWVTVPSLVLLVVSAGNYMFYRVVYVIPFQVLAAVGLFWVFTNFENLFLLKDSRFYWVCKIGVFLLFVLLFLNYALRSVDGAPLHLIELS